MTTRLQLTPIREESASVIFETIDRNRKHLRKYLNWVDNTQAVEDTLHFIQVQRMEAASLGHPLTYELWHNKDFMGLVGFPLVDRGDHWLNLGYWQKEEAQGKGLMTEAVKALIYNAFFKFGYHRIEIRMHPDNRKSERLALRLGATLEATFKDSLYLNGMYHPQKIYVLFSNSYNQTAVYS